MTKVIVLSGGNSAEREVSLRSGAVVYAALNEAGYEASVIDPTEPLNTYLEQFKQADIIFPALHGRGGEDGELQTFLEDNSIAFVGSGSKASRLCFDKLDYLKLVQSEGILIPETLSVNRTEFEASELKNKPYVLKPNDEGSSVDTIISKDLNKVDEAAIEGAFSRHEQMLLEPFIVGDEITVAIVGEKAMPVIEIIPPQDEDFNYDNKYNGKTQELCPPVNISESIQAEASILAERLHKLCGCEDMSRTDMMVGSDGNLYVLETNTIPGLTAGSLLPKAAATAGLTMPSLCKLLIERTLTRYS
jgi:D-alanine-D-alanine ligase